jgi:uncharacterized phage-associated protein
MNGGITPNMPSVFDVAQYILKKQGPMSPMKLQKLVYYAQAWALAWNDAPLFPEEIQAWAYGPVVPELFNHHRGQFQLDAKAFGQGNSEFLTLDQKDDIDRVLVLYGDKTPQWLSELTHLEDPWKHARAGLGPHERGDKAIPLDVMQEYYAGL